MSATEKRKRLSVSEMLEMRHNEAMAYATRPARERDSIELGRSARGETTIAIKTYQTETESSEDLLARAWDMFERTRAKFPLSTGYVSPSTEREQP